MIVTNNDFFATVPGYLNATLLLFAVVPSTIAAIIGAKVSVKLPQTYLKKVFACLILVIGIIMLV